MKRFNEYADDAVKFASPYIKKTGEFFGNAGDEAQRWYYAEKKKYQKRRKIAKIKQFWEDSRNLILIIAGIIGGIAVAMITVRTIVNKVCFSQHKIVSVEEAAQNVEGSAEDNKTEKKNRQNKQKESGSAEKKTPGYITL